jgi:hypothetical protein
LAGKAAEQNFVSEKSYELLCCVVFHHADRGDWVPGRECRQSVALAAAGREGSTAIPAGSARLKIIPGLTGVFMEPLGIWLPVMFGLGIAGMGLCFLFFWGCEKI